MTNYEVIVVSDQNRYASRCFPCSKCSRCTAGKEYFCRDGHKYCADCFAKNFELKCASCKKAIEGIARINFIFYDNRIWHMACFKCSNCKNILNNIGPSKNGEFLNCTRCGAHITCEEKR